MSDILIGGVPFIAVYHHHGRFLHLPGLFAFARRQPSGVYEVLHLEMSEAVARHAVPAHPRWAWALAHGMDSLLLHAFGEPASLSGSMPLDWETVVWHPRAEVSFLGDEEGAEADLAPLAAILPGG